MSFSFKLNPPPPAAGIRCEREPLIKWSGRPPMMFATAPLLFLRQQRQRSNVPTAIGRMAIGRPTWMPSFLLGGLGAGWLIKMREGPVCQISVPLSGLFIRNKVIFWVTISVLKEYQLLRDIIAKPEDLIIDMFRFVPLMSLFWAENCIPTEMLVPGKAVGSHMARYRWPLVDDGCIRNIRGTNLDSVV